MKGRRITTLTRKAWRLSVPDVAGRLPAPGLPLDEAIARAKAEHAEERLRKILRELAELACL